MSSVHFWIKATILHEQITFITPNGTYTRVHCSTVKRWDLRFFYNKNKVVQRIYLREVPRGEGESGNAYYKRAPLKYSQFAIVCRRSPGWLFLANCSPRQNKVLVHSPKDNVFENFKICTILYKHMCFESSNTNNIFHTKSEYIESISRLSQLIHVQSIVTIFSRLH